METITGRVAWPGRVGLGDDGMKVLKIFFWCGVAALCAILASMVILNLTGNLLVVISNSMAPTFRAGDVLILQSAGDSLEPGMIVSYRKGGNLITHRVVRVDGATLVTRGDNNLGDDPWTVPVSSVVGTPFARVPYLGYVIFFLKKPLGFLMIVLIPSIWIMIDVFKRLNKELNRTAKPEQAGKTPSR